MNRLPVVSCNSGSTSVSSQVSRESCCFCIDIKRGSVAIAVFNIILYSITAVLSTILLADGDIKTRLTHSICYHMEDDGECLKPDINRYETWVLLLGSAGFIISVLALPVAGLMIYGVMKGYPYYIMPLFSWNIVDILRDTICFFTLYKLWGGLPEYVVPVFVVMFFILQAMRGYFTSVLWTIYKQMKSQTLIPGSETIALTKEMGLPEDGLIVGVVSEKIV